MNRIEVSIVVHASAPTIFKYLSDPKKFSEWIQAPVAFEARVGSEFRVDFAMQKTVVAGEVLELVENERLRVSWGVAEGEQAAHMPAGSTEVEISLEPVERGTLVTIRHSGLPSEQEAKDHESGWNYYLAQIDMIASAEHLGALMRGTIPQFLAAWNETDPHARAELLKASFALDGRYLGRYGVMNDRNALDAHIAQSQKFVPGFAIRADGEPKLSHGHVCFGWFIEGQTKEQISKGLHFGSLTPDGKLERVVAFWD